MADTLHNAPLVIDNGTGTLRAGFAGSDAPALHFPAFVGRPKHPRVLAGALEGDVFVGARAQELRGLLKINYPLEHGVVTDWDDMERIWEWVYRDGLRVLSEEHPVLLTEPPLNPKQNRLTAAQILFETFNIPALHLSIQAVLSLYASGRTTGTVLDSGDGVTHAVPVYEGFTVPSAIRRVDLAGRDVTDHLRVLLRKNGCVLDTSAEREVVRLIKEKCCYLAVDVRKEEREWAGLGLSGGGFGGGGGGAFALGSNVAAPGTAAKAGSAADKSGKLAQYTLPDGHVLNLGAERFRAPELLFSPSLVGSEADSLPALLSTSIQKTDLDLRALLYGNIILSGGSTLTRNFGDRLLQELKGRAARDVRIKIFAPPERKYSTWIGGSILAGLSTFRRMWVSSEEWGEDPDVVVRRFLG